MKIKVDKHVENADWPKEMRRIRAESMLAKHYGPGPHPSGSDQSAHAGSRISVPSGKGVLGGVAVKKILVAADGSELPNSFAALPGAHYIYEGGDGEILASSNSSDIQERILEKVRSYNLDPDDIGSNLQRIMDSAIERYAAHPEMIEVDKFYEQWHLVYSGISERTGIPIDWISAAGSAMSPGLSAYVNIHYANDMATWISEDLEFSGEDAKEVLEVLDHHQDTILNPVWMEGQAGVRKDPSLLGKPKSPPTEGSARWQQGESLRLDYENLKDRSSFRLSELSSLSAVHAMATHRARYGGTEIPDFPEALRIDHESGELIAFPQGGFSIKNGGFFEKAVNVLRGDLSPNEILGDVKTRSFHNNIMDPWDIEGFDDVTVDYHATDSAFFTVGMGDDKAKASSVISSPALEGVGVGVRPLIADHIRRIGRNTVVGGERLTGLRAQEILWAEWSRGRLEARELEPLGVPAPDWVTNPRQVTHWQAFDGTIYPLTKLK